MRRGCSRSQHLHAQLLVCSAQRLSALAVSWSSMQAFLASSSNGIGGVGSGSASAGAAAQ
jgi:hypothetical protein